MDLENKNVNALRMLAIDMIEEAKSGHPGIALGCAPTLYSLYSKHLNVVPSDDKNILRDRFVMSAGHGSSIYYATLHAFGYDISMEDLKNFRKLDSKTPGHPEFGLVPGVDATTGPLGQGVSMAVGMAIAQRVMGSRFNKPDLTLFDNYTYALVGEGCLMEGVSYEALSLAGSLKLNKLIVLYDCNNVTLDGKVEGVFNQDIMSYMQSLGFNTIEVFDGNNVDAINDAIVLAKSSIDKPSFIKINTLIGYGSVYEGSNKAHGNILGPENVALLREKLHVKTSPFELSKDVSRDLVFLKKRFVSVEKMFKERLKIYKKSYPGDYRELQSIINGEVKLSCLDGELLGNGCAGREMGGLILNALAKDNSNIVALSADLFSSTKAMIKESGYVNANFGNKNLECGIREFAMGAISNGLALYGGLLPVQSTFMVFSDYLKPALRLSAMMNKKIISVFTHDSIAVGEDGATHQCSEQLWGLRSIPNTRVYRPANFDEAKWCYASACMFDGPSIMALSRQKLADIPTQTKDVLMGGYIIAKEGKGKLDAIILATGSEVGLAIEVKSALWAMGYNVRVVSMPCLEVFDEQPLQYKKDIIPSEIANVFALEAGGTSGWYKYVGKFGKCFGVDSFGASGKPDDVYKKFNLTCEDITKEIVKIIKVNSYK